MRFGWTGTGVMLGLLAWGIVAVIAAPAATAQDRALSGRAKERDANNNGVIDRNEARGPLADNFDAIDCDKSGGLDGAEIRGYFSGGGCPAKSADASPSRPTAAPAGGSKALSGRSKGLDQNGNGVVDKSEARGPLAANFDKIDKDKSGGLDGAEIRAFFQGGGAGSGGRRAGGRPPARVVIDEIVTQPIAMTYPVIGRLVARQSGAIASEIAGIIVEMRVEVGDRVAKGDLIARFSRDRLKADRARYRASVNRYKGLVATAQAEYEKVQREFQRLTRLKSSAAFSRARYEDLQGDLQSRKGALSEKQGQLAEAQAQLDRVLIDLHDTEIRAPFSGVVSEKNIDVGTYVRAGDRVVTLVNDRTMEIEAEVPSNRLNALKAGVPVSVHFSNGSQYKAKVRAVVPVENLRTRTRPVRFTPDFNGAAGRLATNESVTVEIPVASVDKALTVHKDAVVRDGDDSFVYVVKNGSASRQKVALGEAIGSRFIVVSGVAPGDKVVVKGNESLGIRRPVRIIGSVGG